MAEPRLLKLQSPAYGDPIFYKWPLVVTKRLDEPAEIAETIRLVCDDFPELKYAVENVILKDYDAKDYDSMNQLCQRYNKAIRNILSLWKGRAPPPRMFQPPNRELLRHILNLCYSHAINEPEKLNLYEPFSPEVYGETSFDMIAQILDEVQVSNDQIFLDLGSGVGQVVLQAAASNLFKECFGVEKAQTPAEYSKAMEAEFKKWMDWFGKIYTDFTLEKGDFMDDKWKDVINDCGVVFVNNFAFGPVVNHHLKTRFQTMKEGSKVISSREFVPMNFKFNKRNLSELGAMIRVTEIKPRGEAATVSWTGNSVSYFLHVVDRTRLEKYFSILKKKKEGQDLDEDEISLCSESNNSVDTSGTPLEETLEENLDDLYLGTTTRHQWQLLTDTINQSKQDVGKVMPGREAKTRGRIKLTQQVFIRKSGKLQMKNKILQKYGHQKLKKKIPSHDSFDSSDGVDSIIQKSKALKAKKLIKKNKILQKYGHQQPKKKISSQDSFDSSDGVDSIVHKAKALKAKKLTKEHKENKKVAAKGDLGNKSNLLGKNLPGRKRLVKPRVKVPSSSEVSDVGAVSPTQKESSLKSNVKNEAPNHDVENQVDEFLAGMKVRYLEFIKRINMMEYAERLKVMIECETAKKKLLTQEINETERMVQNLISDSLRNFSSRLVELDLAVKTPLDLLSKSSVLAEKHQELENKVVNMEIEVFNLEEKYKMLCTARNQKNRKYGLEPMIDSDPDEIMQDYGKTDRKKELETKLCGAILSALNHRRTLMDQQSSLSEQISILEKISHADGNNSGEVSVEKDVAKLDEKPSRPKSRPVAFVPPRMLSDNKKNTISPEATRDLSMLSDNAPQRNRRGRRRKRSKTTEGETRSPSGCSDSSQDSKTDLEDRSFPVSLRTESSESLNDDTSRESPQNAQLDKCYLNYQAQEQRAPITFPRNHVDDLKVGGKHLTRLKSTKQFLKTSGKLLNAAPNKWCSAHSIQQEKNPYGGHFTKTNIMQNSFSGEIPPEKILSEKFDIPDPNITGSYNEMDNWKKRQKSERTTCETKNGVKTPAVPASVSSFSINNPPSPSPSRFKTIVPGNQTINSNSGYDRPMTIGQEKPISCKPSPTYGVSMPSSFNNNSRRLEDDTVSMKSPVSSISTIGGKTSVASSKLIGKANEKEEPSQTNAAALRKIYPDVKETKSAPVSRNISSVWTSSTFSVSHLMPEPQKKSITESILPVPVSQVSNCTPFTRTSSNSTNIDSHSNIFSNSSLSNPPVQVHGGDASMASQNRNPQPVSDSSLLSVPSSDKLRTKSPSKNDVEKECSKKKDRKPKMDSVQSKNRYNHSYAMLSSSNIPPARGNHITDPGMKRKLEDSFHSQFTNPDVEDHFRTTFNKFVQNSSRESMNSILEKGKVTASPSVTSTISSLNSNVSQVSMYMGSHHFIPHNDVSVSHSSNKSHDNSSLDANRQYCTNEKSALISFSTDKPIPYPRCYKDSSEAPASSSTHILISSASSGLPSYVKSSVSNIAPKISFTPSSSSNMLYCPSTMKLLVNNLDNSKLPPGYLSSTSKTAAETPVAHIDVANSSRCPRKPNPDRFLNSFPGGTFIPPVTGGRPTFIPSLPTVLQESKVRPASNAIVKAPPAKRGRGRRPKNIEKKAAMMNPVGVPESAYHIDFSKSPSNSVTIPIYNPPPSNIINAGFRPPIIRNTISPLQNPLALSLDVRGLRPHANQITLTDSSISNRMMLPRTTDTKSKSSATTFPIRTSLPVNTVAIPQASSPGSPTYNHPRFVLLNMPTVMMVSGNDNQVLQRQRSMTSPTFPPPNS